MLFVANLLIFCTFLMQLIEGKPLEFFLVSLIYNYMRNIMFARLPPSPSSYFFLNLGFHVHILASQVNSKLLKSYSEPVSILTPGLVQCFIQSAQDQYPLADALSSMYFKRQLSAQVKRIRETLKTSTQTTKQ